MKKLFFLLPMIVLLAGCGQKSWNNFDVSAIKDIQTLEMTNTILLADLQKGTLDVDFAQTLVTQLQDKYLALTDTPQIQVEKDFDTIDTILTKQAIWTLPLRVKRLGITEPQGMQRDKKLSSHTTGLTGHDSITLVYQGTYQQAMQQSSQIAKKANLKVSEEFLQAQALANAGNINYISGLDINMLKQGIVYTNHNLTDTHITNLISISVDANGMLTISASK